MSANREGLDAVVAVAVGPDAPAAEQAVDYTVEEM